MRIEMCDICGAEIEKLSDGVVEFRGPNDVVIRACISAIRRGKAGGDDKLVNFVGDKDQKMVWSALSTMFNGNKEQEQGSDFTMCTTCIKYIVIKALDEMEKEGSVGLTA